jgi:ABC-type transport system involved in cytochrome c biogenesis permease subunit
MAPTKANTTYAVRTLNLLTKGMGRSLGSHRFPLWSFTLSDRRFPKKTAWLSMTLAAPPENRPNVVKET